MLYSRSFLVIYFIYISVYTLIPISAAATGALKHRRPRGATPRPRSGAEAGRTPCPKGGGQEELPHVRGQGQRPRVPDCDGTGTAERRYPESEVRGGSQEEIPHAPSLRPGATGWRSYPTPLNLRPRAAAREEQPHDRGQGRCPGGQTPRPRSHGCAGAGGPRGAIPHFIVRV